MKNRTITKKDIVDMDLFQAIDIDSEILKLIQAKKRITPKMLVDTFKIGQSSATRKLQKFARDGKVKDLGVLFVNGKNLRIYEAA